MTPDEGLRRYREVLLTWSARVNLIGPEARQSLDEHIGEAVAAARILEPSGNVLDFGSGGGLPAIPMALVSPHATFHLVEADQKKWSFLKHVIRECGLKSIVHGDRLDRVLERLPPEMRFSLVVSRAVGHPETWLPLVHGRLDAGGRVALFQRRPEIPEVGGYEADSTAVLPRGSSNFLVTLKVPRGTT